MKVHSSAEFDSLHEKIEAMDAESEAKCPESVPEALRIESLTTCEKVVKDPGEDKV